MQSTKKFLSGSNSKPMQLVMIARTHKQCTHMPIPQYVDDEDDDCLFANTRLAPRKASFEPSDPLSGTRLSRKQQPAEQRARDGSLQIAASRNQSSISSSKSQSDYPGGKDRDFTSKVAPKSSSPEPAPKARAHTSLLMDGIEPASHDCALTELQSSTEYRNLHCDDADCKAQQKKHPEGQASACVLCVQAEGQKCSDGNLYKRSSHPPYLKQSAKQQVEWGASGERRWSSCILSSLWSLSSCGASRKEGKKTQGKEKERDRGAEHNNANTNPPAAQSAQVAQKSVSGKLNPSATQKKHSVHISVGGKEARQENPSWLEEETATAHETLKKGCHSTVAGYHGTLELMGNGIRSVGSGLKDLETGFKEAVSNAESSVKCGIPFQNQNELLQDCDQADGIESERACLCLGLVLTEPRGMSLPSS